MAHLLGAHQVHVGLPDRVLLEEVTLGVGEGDRIGVVGRNGDGKSTLLRLLSGGQQPDAGRVTVRGGVRVGVLDQRDLAPAGMNVRERVVGDRPTHEWASVPRIRDVLAGLLRDIDLDAEMTALSGGQVRRVNLAALLVGDWDVLFLDEPTNHLDVEGIAWLAEHLRTRWPAGTGGLVVVTHDRWFLDAVCTRMWEVHDGVVDQFEGGYAAYVLQRVERERQAAATEARRQNLMRKELAWLRRGAPARTSKPKFRIEAANELIAGEPPVRNQVELTQLATSRLGRDVIDLLEVTAGYDGRAVLSDVTMHVGPADRIGILGPNGAGKSTLLGLIAGTMEPMSGRVKRGKTVSVQQVSQRLEGLAEHQNERVATMVGRYRTSYQAGKDEVSPSMLLERLGFTAAHQKVQVKELSGGQQRRLDLLLTLLDEPNVLVLDEPTNDMDTDMLTALEDLLDTWPGPLLVVSHDRYLLERVTDIQYAVIGGSVRHLPGGVEEYLRLSARGAGADRYTGGASASAGGAQSGAGGATSGAGGVPADGGGASSGAVGSHSGADGASPASRAGLSGAEARALEKEQGSLERRIAKLTAAIDDLSEQMAQMDPADYTDLQELATEQGRMREELDAAEERWLEIGEQLGG